MAESHLDSSTDIIIVGAGIIGLMSAHYLVEEGFKVTVIDQENIGAACSYGNCGYICPSHILPLTEPGMVFEGFKSLFNPKSAFRIKPQLRPSFYYWLLQFARRCNRKNMLQSTASLKSILDLSRLEYGKLFAQFELDAQWKEDGLMYVFETEKALQEFAETDELLSSKFDCKAQFLSSEDLSASEPALKQDLAGAFFYKGDASIKPDRLTAQLAESLKKRGVNFIENCHLHSVNKQGGKISSLMTSKGELRAEQYVFATGAWSRLLSKELNETIPVEPAKGYSITIRKPDNCVSSPILFPEHRVGLTPFDNSLRLGSMMEFVGYDNHIPKHRINQLFDSAKPYLNDTLSESYETAWTGWRPMTWDSLPIIGYAKNLNNAVLATGHNMLGMTLAPATGRLVAQIIVGKQTSIDIKPYESSRF